MGRPEGKRQHLRLKDRIAGDIKIIHNEISWEVVDRVLHGSG
jgi:hypothetical protein